MLSEMEIAIQDNQVELEDLIEFYPDIEIQEIQKIITAKHEFNELASDPFETLSKLRGQYYRHQLFTQRFLRAYDELLLFHQPGTGKTCAMAATAEWFKNARLRGETNIKKALFLVKNDTLETQLAKEIVCRCTENVYD